MGTWSLSKMSKEPSCRHRKADTGRLPAAGSLEGLGRVDKIILLICPRYRIPVRFPRFRCSASVGEEAPLTRQERLDGTCKRTATVW